VKRKVGGRIYREVRANCRAIFRAGGRAEVVALEPIEFECVLEYVRRPDWPRDLIAFWTEVYGYRVTICAR
jgi:hypothetical protein